MEIKKKVQGHIINLEIIKIIQDMGYIKYIN